MAKKLEAFNMIKASFQEVPNWITKRSRIGTFLNRMMKYIILLQQLYAGSFWPVLPVGTTNN